MLGSRAVAFDLHRDVSVWAAKQLIREVAAEAALAAVTKIEEAIARAEREAALAPAAALLAQQPALVAHVAIAAEDSSSTGHVASAPAAVALADLPAAGQRGPVRLRSTPLPRRRTGRPGRSAGSRLRSAPGGLVRRRPAARTRSDASRVARELPTDALRRLARRKMDGWTGFLPAQHELAGLVDGTKTGGVEGSSDAVLPAEPVQASAVEIPRVELCAPFMPLLPERVTSPSSSSNLRESPQTRALARVAARRHEDALALQTGAEVIQMAGPAGATELCLDCRFTFEADWLACPACGSLGRAAIKGPSQAAMAAVRAAQLSYVARQRAERARALERASSARLEEAVPKRWPLVCGLVALVLVILAALIAIFR